MTELEALKLLQQIGLERLARVRELIEREELPKGSDELVDEITDVTQLMISRMEKEDDARHNDLRRDSGGRTADSAEPPGAMHPQAAQPRPESD